MSLQHDFKGRHVVITGGGGALGSHLVGRLLESGAVCHIPSFDPKETFAKHERLQVTREIDLTSERAVDGFYSALPSLWASIHIAGGFAMSPITGTSKADFDAMMAMNATSCFLCCRAAVAAFRKGGQGGRIVNVAARPALDPRKGGGMVAYTASKAAVAAITGSLSEEVLADDVLVNAVAPSVLDTPGNRQAMPKSDPKNWVSLDAATDAILFLASPANAATSGSIMPLYAKS